MMGDSFNLAVLPRLLDSISFAPFCIGSINLSALRSSYPCHRSLRFREDELVYLVNASFSARLYPLFF